MITYTQSYKRAADIIGISATTNSQALTNIQQDLNQGLRMFKNASRRYWTRKEGKTDLVAGQQYYTFPEDMVRITTVRINNGALTIPIGMIDSEDMWNRLNLIPAMTVGIPTRGFIRGRNELGLYPIPSVNVAGGLIVSYEPRLREMNIDDITANLTLTQNSQSVVVSGSTVTDNVVGMYLAGPDGNWYPIAGFTDSTHFTLENVYQGDTGTYNSVTIGQVPDIPEDYHMAPIYFAAYNYFLKRKDQGTAAGYKSLFDDLISQYKSVYASKETGMVQRSDDIDTFNIFTLPPMNVTS